MSYNPTLLADFYKIHHREQYPPGTEDVYSTWTPRESRVAGVGRVVAFGFQGFVARYLVDYFNENFFSQPKEQVLADYSRIIRNTLGERDVDVSHLAALHDLGYLPLRIKALAEGTLVPLRVPMVTIENTRPEFFWLTNYIETLFSNESWMASTSATTAFEYRKLFERYARETGADPAGIAFQGHDFSMRGMSSVEAAAMSGAGHLLSFAGTDTIPAILFLERYYGANTDDELVGTSIPATEHSVMCAYGDAGERGTFERLIGELYPSGFVSIVSDTWDLWAVIGDYLPALRERILARDGKVVIRPDSGDPVDIITGNGCGDGSLADKGVVEALWDIFGGTVTDRGYRVLDPHIGAIYGDSISLERGERILRRLADKGFASSNIVFGVGSFSYQHTTRDTFGFALKSTSVTVNGVEKAIFKDPVTDLNHTKRSARGRVAVVDDGGLKLIDGLHSGQRVEGDLLRVIFEDGKMQNVESLAQIRERLHSGLEEVL